MLNKFEETENETETVASQYRPKVIEVLMEVVVNRALTVNSLDLAECRGLTEQRLDWQLQVMTVLKATRESYSRRYFASCLQYFAKPRRGEGSENTRRNQWQRIDTLQLI